VDFNVGVNLLPGASFKIVLRAARHGLTILFISERASQIVLAFEDVFGLVLHHGEDYRGYNPKSARCQRIRPLWLGK